MVGDDEEMKSWQGNVQYQINTHYQNNSKQDNNEQNQQMEAGTVCPRKSNPPIHIIYKAMFYKWVSYLNI